MDTSKISKKSLESFIISWNVRFKCDRLWRKKYGISFGSKQHLEMDQVSIYLDILEDKLAERIQKAEEQKQQALLDYRKTGNFLKETVLSQEDEELLFSKIKLPSNDGKESNI